MATSAAPETVTFNVGRFHYEVSRSLLEQFPNCLMTRMASKEWAKDETNDNKSDPLIINRDGHRFQYVLDFMRKGGGVETVAIPFSISKPELLDDMTYYGFEDISDKVFQQFAIDQGDTVAHHRKFLNETFTAVEAELEEEFDMWEMKRLASFCFLKFMESGDLEIPCHTAYRSSSESIPFKGKIIRFFNSYDIWEASDVLYHRERAEKAFEQHLASFKLTFVSIDLADKVDAHIIKMKRI